MLPAVLNNIGSSHDLLVILLALVTHHGCQSYSSSLDVFPYHWKVIHFSHKKFECLEVTLRQDITNPQIYTRVYSEGSVCQAGPEPRHYRLYQHQFEGLLDWLLWVPLEQICRVLLEKCLKVFEVDSKSFSKYLLYLFEVDHYAPSTMISHWTSITSVLQHWIYDSATDPHIRALLHNFHLAWPIEPKMMPQWNLHLILSALLWPPFSDGAVDRPSDDVIGQKWWTLKTTLLLLATARRRSYLELELELILWLSACFMCVNLPLHMGICAESVSSQSLITCWFSG